VTNIVTEYQLSEADVQWMQGFAATGADRAFRRVTKALDDGRLGSARFWLKYAALRIALLKGREQRTRCRIWLDLVVRLAHASLAAAQP
jgi:hypothetical protein